MAPTIEQLISPELAAAANRIFQGVEGALPVYVHASGGPVAIGGGSVGAQTINSLAMDPDLVQWMQGIFKRLDQILDLDFELRETSNGSKINIYLDQEINLGDGSTTLGLALSNEPRRRSWWEVVLNGPPLLRDLNYLHFAFIHELGHVFGLEHPFDNSDGDVGGERFSAPDASVTVMSYTKPPGGWPSFYTSTDLAALVSLWGLEDDQGQDWLIRDSNQQISLWSATAAAARLTQQLAGDELVGVAPSAPQAPLLQAGPTAGSLEVQGLLEGGQWEVSWTGGRRWTPGGRLPAATADPLATPGTSSRTLLPPGVGPWDLVVRQRDRWGRVSPSASQTVSGRDSPALQVSQILLPANQRQATVRARATTTAGQPVVFWTMESSLAAANEPATAIRRAVAEVDQTIELDFQEIPVGEVSSTPDPGSPIDSGSGANLAQLRFSSAELQGSSEEPGQLLGQNSSDITTVQVAGQTMRLKGGNRISLDLQALASAGYPTLATAVQQVALHELGHALGLCHPWSSGEEGGLSWASFSQEQTVMAYGSTSLPMAGAGLTTLDRQALTSLHGVETNPADPAPTLDPDLPQVSIGAPRASRTSSSETKLSWSVVRRGNPRTEVQLALRARSWQPSAGSADTPINANSLETLLTLAPGQLEGALELGVPSGKLDQLQLELLVPADVRTPEIAEGVLSVNLHQLELALSPQQLIQQSWLPANPSAPPQREGLLTRRDRLIFWHLDPSLEATWGPSLRSLIQDLDQACGLTWREVEVANPLCQLRLTAQSSTATDNGSRWNSLQVQRNSTTWSIGSFSTQIQTSWQVGLPGNPLSQGNPSDASAQQDLLRWLLLNLGMESPNDSSDGDSYSGTPVYPQDSALFTAWASSTGPGGAARLQPLDRQALALLHGVESPDMTAPPLTATEPATLPSWQVQINSARSGLRFSPQGPRLQLELQLQRQGNLTIESRSVIWINRSSGAPGAALEPRELSWSPGESGKVIQMELPLETRSLELSLLDLNNPSTNPPTPGLSLSQGVLLGVKQRLQADPISGWSPDLNADGRFDPELEGQLLLRHALGTFPGRSLTQGVRGLQPTSPPPEALLSPPDELVRAHLLQGQELGLLPGCTPGPLDPLGTCLPESLQDLLS